MNTLAREEMDTLQIMRVQTDIEIGLTREEEPDTVGLNRDQMRYITLTREEVT